MYTERKSEQLRMEMVVLEELVPQDHLLRQFLSMHWHLCERKTRKTRYTAQARKQAEYKAVFSNTS